MIFYETFKDGIQEPIDAVTSEEGLHAFYLTLALRRDRGPLNTIFGVLCALMLVRDKFPRKGLINSLIDLPSLSHRS